MPDVFITTIWYVAGIARICSSPKVVAFTLLPSCIHVDMVSIPGDGLIL